MVPGLDQKTKSQGVENTHCTGSSKHPLDKRRKEIKPVVINDTLTIIDSDDKPDIDTQSQNTQTKLPSDLTRSGVRQTTAYSHPVIRPPPKSPDLADRRNYGTDTGIDPNLDFEENSHPSGRYYYRNV